MDEADRLILPAAVLFDMDGTLTEPMLDFPRIKAEMGIGQQPILEAMSRMTPAERRVAGGILERHETEAARLSCLNSGCHDLLGWLEGRGIATALITRNSAASVNVVLARHGLKFPVLITRDDAPPKPDPEPLRLACERLGVAGPDAWMVGDGQYDVEAGNAAGILTVWLSHRRERLFPTGPSRVVADLWQLLELLRICE